MKRDFIHNLDIIKELEGKVRKFDEENSKINRDLLLAKNQISDLALKRSEAEEKSVKEINKRIVFQNFLRPRIPRLREDRIVSKI